MDVNETLRYSSMRLCKWILRDLERRYREGMSLEGDMDGQAFVTVFSQGSEVEV